VRRFYSSGRLQTKRRRSKKSLTRRELAKSLLELNNKKKKASITGVPTVLYNLLPD
jgi:hypothetical protein